MAEGDAVASEKAAVADRTTVTRHPAKGSSAGREWIATAGRWNLRDDRGAQRCAMSFVSWVSAGPDGEADPDRPVTFVFNGGPGSASVWLHLGVFGPHRIEYGDGLTAPRPPYRVVDNEHTLLHRTDLVFIDPVATGHSTVHPEDEGKDFLGLDEDTRWVAEFIRLWLARNGRWSSPKFVAGESYGTTRAASLADHLGEVHGIGLSGVLLISSILMFQTLYPALGNDLPYVLALPTLAATAWYHGRTDPSLGGLEAVVARAEELATGRYATFLLREATAATEEREGLAADLAALIGVPAETLLRNRLRLAKDRFRKELRRGDGLIVGHFDGRVTGFDADAGSAAAAGDPSFGTVRPAFTATYLHYLRSVLQVEADEPYTVLNAQLGRNWVWGEDAKAPKYVDVAGRLRSAMLADPDLRVFLANGYFDFATPFFAAEWTLEHLGLPAERRADITMRRYPGGHMMYTEAGSLAALAADMDAFIGADGRAC